MPDRQTGRQLPAPSRAGPRDLPASSRAGRDVGSASKRHINPIDLHNALLLAVAALRARLDQLSWENSRPEVAA